MAHNSNGRSIWQRYISGLAGFLNAWYSSNAPGTQATITSYLRKANSVAGEIVPQTGDWSYSFWFMWPEAIIGSGWNGFVHRANVYQYQATVNGFTVTTLGGGSANVPYSIYYFAVGDGTVAVTSQANCPTIKQWNLATYTIDRTASLARLYINDATNYHEISVAGITGNIGGTTQNFNVGAGAALFLGMLRDMTVYNKSLSKAEHLEMFNNYASKSPLDCSFSGNVIHYWKLESDGNATVGGVNLSEYGGTNYYPAPSVPLGKVDIGSNYVHLDGTTGCYLRSPYMHSNTQLYAHTIRYRATAPFHFGTGSSNGFYVLSGTTFRIKGNGAAVDFSWAGTDLLDGNWHTLTILSIASSFVKYLYCDGTLLEQKTVNNSVNMIVPFYIGWDAASAYDEMDVSFYSYATPMTSANWIVDHQETARLLSLNYIPAGIQGSMCTAEEGWGGLLSRGSTFYGLWKRGTATFNSEKSFAITKAVYFDGVNDYLTWNTTSLFLYNVTQWSMSFWVEIDSSLNTDAVLADWSNADAIANGFRLETAGLTAGGSCKLKFTAGATTPAFVQTDANCLNAGQKHLVVIRFKGSNTLEIKVDGAKPAQTVTGAVPATTSTTQHQLYFGASRWAPQRFFKGKIAYLGINFTNSIFTDWTDANDTSHWNSGSGAFYIEPLQVFIVEDPIEYLGYLKVVGQTSSWPSFFKSNGAIVTSW